MDESNVFHPRNSLGRSPTRKSINLDSDTEEAERIERTKNVRQEEKRRKEDRTKTKQSTKNLATEEEVDEEQEMMEILNNNDTDKKRNAIIRIINTQLDQIEMATSRLSSGKLAFLKSDQVMVRSSTRRLENVLLHITNEWTATIQKLETEKVKTDYYKILYESSKEKQEVDKTQRTQTAFPLLQAITTNNEQQPTTTIKTYATITQTRKQQEQPKTWKPPTKETKTFETVVKSNTNKPEEIIKEMKKVLTHNDMDKNTQIRRTNTAIIISSQSQNKQKELQQKLTQNTKLQTKDGTRIQDPMLIITGMHKGTNTDEIFNDILLENNDIRRTIGDRLKADCKIIGVRPCRNPYKQNVIIQCPGDIFRQLITDGYIYHDLTRLYLEEYIPCSMCFKCCRYGHSAKYCIDKTFTCFRCSGAHDGRQCKSSTLNCANCDKMRLVPRGHQARDMNCPVYRKKVDQSRNQIAY